MTNQSASTRERPSSPEPTESEGDASTARSKPRDPTFIQAIHQAQIEEMRRDPNVIIMGEDLVADVFGTTGGLLEEFGPNRVMDTPLSENGFAGAAIGAAMTGLRPI